MEVYDTIKLPNGGMIQMDQLAYETFQGICRSNYRGEWTVSLDFKDNVVETAVAHHGPNKEIEIH